MPFNVAIAALLVGLLSLGSANARMLPGHDVPADRLGRQLRQTTGNTCSENLPLFPFINLPSSASTFTKTLEQQAGATDEVINVRLDWGANFSPDNPDAPHNLLVTIELNHTSQSGTEDLVAIALGGIIEDHIPPGEFTITHIATGVLPDATVRASPTTAVPFINPGQITRSPRVSPALPVNVPLGGTETPYDVLIGTNKGGAGDGIVQRVTFLISAMEPIDQTLLEGTRWYLRLQSTDGGQGSAKTFGSLPESITCNCYCPPADQADACQNSHVTQFDNHAGTTKEVLNFRMDWNANFLTDQPNAPHNLLICLELDEGSLSSTEDIVSISFGDIAAPIPANLRIESIQTGKLAAAGHDLSDTTPVAQVSPGQMGTPSGCPGGSIPAAGQNPFDAAICVNAGGLGDGLVQKVCFVLAADTAIDQSLLQGTRWSVRLQSTGDVNVPAGTGSARTLGNLDSPITPSC